MYRFVISVVGAVTLLIAPSASASIQQQADVKVKATSGTMAPKGVNYVKIQSYLSTRDPASTRTAMKANPVGNVLMTFPAGSTINQKATVGCKVNVYSPVLAIKTSCASSVIGDGWALMNNLGLAPLPQLTEAPVPCAADDATQYTRTYQTAAPTCTPRGFIWVHVRAYQGGKVNNVFKSNVIIFANENAVAPLAFPGVITGNKLSVTLPALNGNTSEAGELPFGVVLSDFALNINKTNYLKAGACPRTKKWNVSTKVTYSKLVGEDPSTRPAPITVNSVSSCR